MKDLDFILDRNRECLIRFGITDFDHQLLFFRQVLKKIGVEQILRWQELLLEPVYWPKISLGLTDEHLGWVVRPCPWYFKMAATGRIFRRDQKNRTVFKRKPWILHGGVYLIDTRQKPVIVAGQWPTWPHDSEFLGKCIEECRRETKRTDIPLASRFCMGEELRSRLSILLAQQPEFQAVKFWRSERASEWNFINQCFSFMSRRWDGETNTRVIFDDWLEGMGTGENALTGGSYDHGGLANIDSVFSERFCNCKSRRGISVRFLGILTLES